MYLSTENQKLKLDLFKRTRVKDGVIKSTHIENRGDWSSTAGSDNTVTRPACLPRKKINSIR